ncbi:MAG: hypothetical protein ACJ74G_05125 [Blastocatellia bacterium]
MRKVLALFFLSLFMAGCSMLPHEAPPEDIDKAAALFVQRLNAAQYDAIYKDAARKFKDNQTKETILDSLKELTAKGKLQEYRRIKMAYEGEGKDRVASPVYSTAFEQTRGDLTLNFIDESGEWKLVGFTFKQRLQARVEQPQTDVAAASL